MLVLLSEVKNNITFSNELYKAVDEAYVLQIKGIHSSMLYGKFISKTDEFLDGYKFDKGKLKEIFKEFIEVLESEFSGDIDAKEYVKSSIFYNLEPYLKKNFVFNRLNLV